MPWLGETRAGGQLLPPQKPRILDISGTTLTIQPFQDEAVRFWSIFQLVDATGDWRLVKKLPRTLLEWELMTGPLPSGSFRVQAVDGANRLSEPSYFDLKL